MKEKNSCVTMRKSVEYQELPPPLESDPEGWIQALRRGPQKEESIWKNSPLNMDSPGDIRRHLLCDLGARAKSIIIEGLFFRIDPNRAFCNETISVHKKHSVIM